MDCRRKPGPHRGPGGRAVAAGVPLAAMTTLRRAAILPESDLPDPERLVDEALAGGSVVGTCPFLTEYAVDSEYAYKQTCISSGRIMLHAQIGYRTLEQSACAWSEIHARLADAGHRVDRYGICLDWSMGYPPGERAQRTRGTGLILEHADDFAELASRAPVAPHFGDFVIGMPAALCNTRAALAAGATSVGNLGQFFTFRLPGWDDDVQIAGETVKAIALCAAQPVPILIHSNLDDGFAALFRDMSCALGAVLLERYIVDDLLGGHASHCYGHTYSEPLARLAFQRALARIGSTPGTMVYGNTTIYDGDLAGNFAALASYLTVDMLAQMEQPTGHAVNPVPVTEALRIPSVHDVVEAHLFANRLLARCTELSPLFDTGEADRIVDDLVAGARRFAGNCLDGLSAAGIDTGNALELLLALRRLGARRLEESFGPGKPEHDGVRRPIVPASTLHQLEQRSKALGEALDDDTRRVLGTMTPRVCVATTDVHEYGKLLLEQVFALAGVTVIDGGVCTDPDDLAAIALQAGATAIAVSTYNGVALSYGKALRGALDAAGLAGLPVYIGGKLNQVDDGGDGLPVAVDQRLAALGVIPCDEIGQMLVDLARRQGAAHR